MLRRSKIWKAWSYWVVFSAVVVVFGGQVGLTRSTLFGTPLHGQAGAAPAAYGVVVSKNVMIPMRDGVRLAADIYRPAIEGIAAADKFPVILQRTPYNKQVVSSWAEYFVPHGYIVV